MIEIKIQIENEDIIDCLITALEGGSNYWYSLLDLSMLKYPGEDSFEANIFYTVMDGIDIPVYDIEDSKQIIGYISKENIKRGLQLFIQDKYIFDSTMDADEADILFQYIVLGELVYG